MQQARVEQRLHDDGHAADAVDVVHDVLAEGLQVADVRHLVADAVEVVEGQLDLGLVRDREQVQHDVGGAAEGHGDGDRVLERLLGEDVAGGDAEAQQVDDGLARAVREVVAAAVGRGRGGRAGQAHAERLGDGGHRVGGVHAAAGALAGGEGALDALRVVLRLILPAFTAPTASKESMIVMSFSVPSLSLTQPGRDRAGVEEDAGEVEPRGGHEHAGQRLVAAGEQHGAVEALGHHDGLDAVGDDLAADEGEVHALVAHRDAVGDGDRAELQRVAAAGVHALLRRLREPVEAQVAGRDLVPGRRDADLGLVPVGVAHADGAEHAARGRGLDAVGDDARLRGLMSIRHRLRAFQHVSQGIGLRGPLPCRSGRALGRRSCPPNGGCGEECTRHGVL